MNKFGDGKTMYWKVEAKLRLLKRDVYSELMGCKCRREEKRRIKSPGVCMCCTGYDTGCMVVRLRGVCVKEFIHVFYCYCFPSLFYFLCLFSSFPSSLSSSYFFIKLTN